MFDMMGADSGRLMAGAGVIAVLGLIAAFWSRVSRVLLFLLRPLVAEMTFSSDFERASFGEFLRTQCRSVSLYPRSFTATTVYRREFTRQEWVMFEGFDNRWGLYFFGRRPFYVTGYKGSVTLTVTSAHGTDERDRVTGATTSLHVYYLRGMFQAEWFARRALEFINRRYLDTVRGSKYRVQYFHGSAGESPFARRNPTVRGGQKGGGDHSDSFSAEFRASHEPLDLSWEECLQSQNNRTLQHLVLTDEMEEVLKELRHFFRGEKWFKERGIPWRRGYLLHGPPGTGKTSFARAVGIEFDLPVFVFDLASMDNSEFSMCWKEALNDHNQRVILIEDIDGVFEGRGNIAQTQNFQGLTFDCLLNMIDGADQRDGTILFITTNNPDKLDPALGGLTAAGVIESRPGRIDRVIEFVALGESGRRKIAEQVLQGLPGGATCIEQLVEATANESPAQFQERCFRVALDLFTREHRDTDKLSVTMED